MPYAIQSGSQFKQSTGNIHVVMQCELYVENLYVLDIYNIAKFLNGTSAHYLVPYNGVVHVSTDHLSGLSNVQLFG